MERTKQRVRILLKRCRPKVHCYPTHLRTKRGNGWGTEVYSKRPLVRILLLPVLVAILLATPNRGGAEEPSSTATAAYNNYLARLEGRLAVQHRSGAEFVTGADGARQARLSNGECLVERLNAPTAGELPGALLHHWRGTAFVPGAHAASFEHLLRDFGAYPRVYAPQVVSAHILAQQPERVQATMRVRQKHVLTVVLDTTYDVTFAHVDQSHGYSVSHGSRVTEIDNAGTAKERSLSSAEQHGFLWRIDTYWSWEERDGGLYLQIESVTLTRGIPHGLGWAIGPFVQSIPRESLEFTLRGTAAALVRHQY
ncbi:MAG: hypothetical protein P4K83_08440 [Terracidiphilus sp.]|nr:hypothetical protein [Terracidiphilus sp.]